jgi:hypothetical protein
MTTKNTTQHTPYVGGPWLVYEKKRIDNDDPHAIGVTRVNAPVNDVAACNILGLELDECRANAQLIAAAPELLVACQLYVRAKADGGVSMADLSAKADEAIRAAIARATGDSQAEGGRL